MTEAERDAVAQAIYEAETDHETRWTDLFDSEKEQYFRQADAAIAAARLNALREPR